MSRDYAGYAGRLFAGNRVLGSGFVATSRGLVVTCLHVVANGGGADLDFETLRGVRIPVEFRSEKSAEHDVALLRPKPEFTADVPAATLIPSTELRPDDRFFLKGAGELGDARDDKSVLPATGSFVGTATPYENVESLQLDSRKITRGMSGAGVLFHARGGVAGVQRRRYIPERETTFQVGTCWATPIEEVIALAPDELLLSRAAPAPEPVAVRAPGPVRPSEGWLDWTEHAELRTLIEAVTPPIRAAELVALIWAAAEELGDVSQSLAEEPAVVLDRLNLPWSTRRRLPPVLVYADLLAFALDRRAGAAARNRAEELRSWVELTCAAHGLDDDEASRVRTRIERRLAEPPEVRLAVRFDESMPPNETPNQRFRLDACLYQDDLSLPLPSGRADAGPWHRGELRSKAELLLGRFAALTADLHRTVAHEFIVPPQLLSTAVDEWWSGSGAYRRPLGLSYPVIVRPAGRREAAVAIGRWREKWQLLSGGGKPVAWIHDAACCRAHEHLDPQEELYWGALSFHRQLAKLGGRADLACIALAFPVPDDETAMPDTVMAALNDGMPAMLWARDDGDVTPLRELLAELAVRGELHTLPEQLLKLRIRLEDEHEQPTRFTLVWDAPDRHPVWTDVLAAPVRSHT